jgi:hypothetical protein
MKFKLLLAILSVGLFQKFQAQYQFNLMGEYLQIGAGNYFIHLEKESDVKKTVMSVLKLHRFPHENLSFNKGKNLYFSAYYVNPSDEKYVYIIHALRGREGYDLYFLYCTNTLMHHFEYIEGKELYQLVYDPAVNKNKVLTSFESTNINEK